MTAEKRRRNPSRLKTNAREEKGHHPELLAAKLSAYLASRDEVLLAFLFGSYAKGRATGRSDVDVAVYFRAYDLAAVNDLATELERLLGKNVDLIVLNEAGSSVAWAALRGLPLLIRDRAFYLQYMLDVSREAEDFAAFIEDLWRLRRKRRRRAKDLN